LAINEIVSAVYRFFFVEENDMHQALHRLLESGGNLLWVAAVSGQQRRRVGDLLHTAARV
jgi:hypothetical protein